MPAKDRPAIQIKLPFRNLDELVARVSAEFFSHLYDDVTWCFAIQKHLAFISSRHIQIHNVLNAVDVPDHVFVMIIFHEMLHLEIPPARDSKGRLRMHPRAFWEAESRRSLHYDASWDWLHANLPLRNRPRLECTDIVPQLMRLTPQQRAWARERYGVELPPAIRSDDPSSRLIDLRTWTIAIEARHQRERD